MLKVESDGPILHVTLNRPEVRNALNAELIRAITETFSGVSEGIRAILLRGEGEAFCAGADLRWMREAAGYSEEQNYQDALAVTRMLASIRQSRAVVIALISGPCYGGGCGLAAVADVAMATDQATFAFSEVRLGIVPATISPYVIGKIGASHAAALFTTGEVFHADRALRMGLVHEVAPPPDLDRSLAKKLDSILSSGPTAIAEAKSLAYGSPLDAEASARLLAGIRSGEEAKEGLAAFLEKRRPAYAGDR